MPKPKTLQAFLVDVDAKYDEKWGKNALEKKIEEDLDLNDDQKTLAKELFGIKTMPEKKCLIEMSSKRAPGTVEYGETWGP